MNHNYDTQLKQMSSITGADAESQKESTQQLMRRLVNTQLNGISLDAELAKLDFGQLQTLERELSAHYIYGQVIKSYTFQFGSFSDTYTAPQISASDENVPRLS
jgi:hypothetical protein